MDRVLLTAVFDGHRGDACSEFMASNLQKLVAMVASESAFTNFQELCSSSIIPNAISFCESMFQDQNAESCAGSSAVIALVYEISFTIGWIGTCRVVLQVA